MALSLEQIMKQLEGQSKPPVHLWNPEFCGNIDMRIARDGTWFYMGTPITRERLVKLFASVLRKDDDGNTYLVTPVEKIGITVDDAPFVAVALEAVESEAGSILKFRTNVGDEVLVGADHPITVHFDANTAEPSPYVHVRDNLIALINRPTFYQLVELADIEDVDGKQTLIVRSQGVAFELGEVSE